MTPSITHMTPYLTISQYTMGVSSLYMLMHTHLGASVFVRGQGKCTGNCTLHKGKPLQLGYGFRNGKCTREHSKEHPRSPKHCDWLTNGLTIMFHLGLSRMLSSLAHGQLLYRWGWISPTMREEAERESLFSDSSTPTMHSCTFLMNCTPISKTISTSWVVPGYGCKGNFKAASWRTTLKNETTI